MTNRPTIVFTLIIIVCTMLSTAITMAGGYYLLKHSDEQAYQVLIDKINRWGEPSTPVMTYHSLDKVVMTIKGDDQPHFVMLEIALGVHETDTITVLDSYMPVFRNALLSMFSTKTYEQLQDPSRFEALQSEIKQNLITTLQNKGIEHPIQEVLVTKLVVQ